MFLKFLLHLFLLVGFISCGDMFSDREEPTEGEFSAFNSCEFNPSAISKIMTQNVQAELSCLELNLNLFIEFVESDRPGSLQLERLKTYINEKMPDVESSTIDVIEGIFDLNRIIFGDDKGFIEKENVKKLANTARELNRIMISGNLYEKLTVKENLTYKEYNEKRARVYQGLLGIGELISKIMVENDQTLDIPLFLNKFKNLDNNEIFENIIPLLFVKKILLGGENQLLKANELKTLMVNLGDIGKIIFDMLHFSSAQRNTEEDFELVKTLEQDLISLYSVSQGKNVDDEVIIDFDGLEAVFEKFYPELARFFQYKKAMKKFKKVIFGNEDEVLYANEISYFLKNYAIDLLRELSFTYRVFLKNESYFTKAKKIFWRFLRVNSLSAQEEEFNILLQETVKEFKYFQGSEFAPLFDHQFSRNPFGIFEIRLYQVIMGKFLEAYSLEFDDKGQIVGKKIQVSERGQIYITQEQLVYLMNDFSDLLLGEGFILPGRGPNTAETITLMTSLFHSQSNGDSKLELYEFVEFAVTMFTSVSLSNALEKYLFERCDIDDQRRVMPACYRENFIGFLNSVPEGQSKKVLVYLPALTSYLTQLSDYEYEKYMLDTAKFSRTCSRFTNGEEVPMKWGDYVVSWGGLLSIEQSILRFDSDYSDIMEPDEVDDAYMVYEKAVKGLIPIEWVKNYSYGVFKYLVKYQYLPDFENMGFWDSVRNGLHFGGSIAFRNQQANADRMTFAAVLKIIAANSPANKLSPYPCDTLR